jgi:hypothetical protein
VGFEWDQRKADSNLEKHGVDFADAATVLFDDMAITVLDDSADDENRYVTVGMDALGRCLVVVYTFREEAVRLISTRVATKAERGRYEEKR